MDPPDPHFTPDELLYRRTRQDWFENGELSPAFAPFPEFSVNRGKYSAPADVIRGYPTWGVAQFRVGDIPPPMKAGEDVHGAQIDYRWAPEHLPEEDNYAHSEVRTYRNGIYRKGWAVKSKEVKRYFRHALRLKISLVILPAATT